MNIVETVNSKLKILVVWSTPNFIINGIICLLISFLSCKT